jgi:hypothetical protein
VGERLRGGDRRPEVKNLSRHRRASLGDAALEVEEAQVGFAHRRDHLGGEERLRRSGREPLGDTAAEYPPASASFTPRSRAGRSVGQIARPRPS